MPIVPIYQSPIVLQSSTIPLIETKSQQLDTYNPNPQYSFAYKVEDGYTGDSKSQAEIRSGDVVKGQYSLTDADGYRRIVDYTSDDINGFNAVVSRQPIAVKPIVTQQLLKTTTQPILKTLPLSTATISTQTIPFSSVIAAQPLVNAAPLNYVSRQPVINTVSYATPSWNQNQLVSAY